MKLTPFGETARIMRIKADVSLKAMAQAMSISSSHLSGIEFGEKRLKDSHVEAALAFFQGRVPGSELGQLRRAAEQSKDVVHTTHLTPDARGLVAAFARRIGAGASPPRDLRRWIEEQGTDE